jgi:hypothetical protein
MDNFNRIVHSLKEAGITVFWEMDVVRKFLSERQQLSVVQSRAPPDLGPKKLRLVHIQGAFTLLFVGTAIAFVAILAELAYVRYEIFSLYIFRCNGKIAKSDYKLRLVSHSNCLSPWNNSALTGTDFHEI